MIWGGGVLNTDEMIWSNDDTWDDININWGSSTGWNSLYLDTWGDSNLIWGD
jgi:hypothetical protein